GVGAGVWGQSPHHGGAPPGASRSDAGVGAGGWGGGPPHGGGPPAASRSGGGGGGPRPPHQNRGTPRQGAGAHGVRGELRLRLFNKSSDILLEQDEVLVRLKDGEEHEVSVDGARRADEAILIKLHSVDDRDHAEDLRGALICVRRRDFPPPEE